MYNLITWPLQRNTALYDYAVAFVCGVDLELWFYCLLTVVYLHLSILLSPGNVFMLQLLSKMYNHKSFSKDFTFCFSVKLFLCWPADLKPNFVIQSTAKHWKPQGFLRWICAEQFSIMSSVKNAMVATVTWRCSENPSRTNACGPRHFIIWRSIILVLIITGKSMAILWDWERWHGQRQWGVDLVYLLASVLCVEECKSKETCIFYCI